MSLYWWGRLIGSLLLLTGIMRAASQSFEASNAAVQECAKALADVVCSLRRRLHRRLYWALRWMGKRRSDKVAWWLSQNVPTEWLWYLN